MTMPYYYQTRISNILFDRHLPRLSESELKVLLIVIRQTDGWIDKNTKKAKEWDWISISFFVKKTGLSKRAIGKAIHTLVIKGLIKVKNEQGAMADTATVRRRAKRLYFKATL